MSLKDKANFVGDIAIMSCSLAFALIVFSMCFEIKYVGIGIFDLMIIYSEMKIKYLKLREEEIDEHLKNKK